MNKFYFFIVLLTVFIFGCNTNKEKDFLGSWVISGDTYEREIYLYPKETGLIGSNTISWHIEDGFFYYNGETLKIISVSKENIRFTKLKGTKERPVGAEEVWIRTR